MLKPSQALVLIVLSLLTFGVVMVNSAGLNVESEEAITLERVLLGRPTLYAVIALIMLLLGACVPIKLIYTKRGLQSPIPWIVLGTLGLLVAAMIPGLSREMNGSSRWVEVAGFSLQPSEFAKWSILIVVAWHCTRRASQMKKFSTGFMPAIWLVGVVCALIAIEDLGTAVLIFTVAVAMIVAAGARVWHAATVIPIAAAGFAIAVWQSPYRVRRLLAYLDPYSDAQDTGYQIIQSMAAITGGGLPGRGLGNGIRKFGYLPEDTTDFIFAIVCEELGVFGAAMVLFLYAALIITGFMIIRRLTHPFMRLLSLGILLTIGFQAAINVAVVTGVAPTKGIALPLLSHGGTGWALTAFSIGLLIAMDRTVRDPLQQEQAEPAELDAASGPPEHEVISIAPPSVMS